MATSRTKAILSRKNRINAINKRLKRIGEQEKQLKSEKAKLERECIDFLEKEGVERVSDKTNNVSIKETDVPVMQDMITFFKYVKKNNAPELLIQRCNSAAWRERDQSVPGVGIRTIKKLSITTRRR